MSRAAVILGLGGTGQWVLTYLKKDLMELNNGKMPENVRLIAIDTVTSAEATKNTTWESPDQKSYETSDKRIGSIELDPQTELIHIGGDCRELADEIEKGKYPWMNWFDVKYWKYEAGLGRDNWILDRGAGRFRQFGLLAVYKDLMKGEINSEILKTLPSAIRDIQARVEKNASFELIIVSSIAGGTGSAMLVPLGVLAQHLFGTANVKTRAIVVLPTAFSPGKRSTELELRGGAALRELARSMMPPNGYSGTIDFGPPYREIKYSRPFDGIYFVDGTRQGQPINNDPKYVVFPAVAGWIRQILDEKSGEWFTNFGSTNLKGATDYARRAEGVFGVFGIKSLYMPVRTLRQTYRLKLANRVLRHITDPIEVTSNSFKRLAANTQPTGEIDALAQAYRIFEQTAQFGDEQVLTTAFISELARIVKVGGKNNPNEVLNKAQAGWASKRSEERMIHSWIGPLKSLPDNQEYSDVLRLIKDAEDSLFPRKFSRSDQAKPPRDPSSNLAFTILNNNIDTYIAERLGGRGAKGVDDYGLYGKMADIAGKVQEDVYRKLMRLRMLSLLSAESGKGRLGYTVEVLKKAEGILADFIEFLDAVENQRGALAPQAELDRAITAARNLWLQNRNTKPTLFEALQSKFSEKALRAEGAYLDAYHKYINYVQEVALHNKIKATAKQMRAFTEETRKDLARWEATLLEGDKAHNVSGLLSDSVAHLNQIATAINEDVRSNEIEELVAVQRKEADIPPEDEAWANAGIRWKADFSGENLSFKLAIEPDAQDKGELNIGANSTNLGVLEGVLGQRFGQFNQVENVLDWCVKHKAAVDEFASELDSGAALLTNLSNNAQPVMQTYSVSIKKTQDATAYAENLERALRLRINKSPNADNNRPVEVIDSDDPYRVTAVRTQLGLKLEEFKFWDMCNDAYQDELKNKVIVRPDIGRSSEEQLSNDSNKKLANALKSQFTQIEEKQAVELEVKWREDGLTHRVLNPRFVSLLGQDRKFRAALQCWALGWIQEIEDKSLADQYHWELQVPGWEYDFWITANGKKGERDDLQVLESLVLIGKNNSRDYLGNSLVWDSLYSILRQQRDATPEAKITFANAVKVALDPGNIVAHWETQAKGTLSSETNRMEYQNPAYHDLADYAKRYFKNL